jgi:hypothetical protein
VVLPHLPASLAGPGAVERLRRLGAGLPMGEAVVLETGTCPDPIGPTSPVDPVDPAAGRHPAVDLSLQVTTPALAVALAGRSPAADSIAWRRFLRTWARRPAWRLRAPALWLEYDLDRAVRSLPAPADPPLLPAPAQAPAGLPQAPEPVICARLAAGAEARWVASWLLPAMRGVPLRREQRQFFQDCWAAIPPPGVPLYVFSLLARGTGAVRLELGGSLRAGELAAYLDRLGAPGPAARVAALQPLLAEADRLHLSCDLEDRDGAIAPRVGVEVSFAHQPRREPRWARLLERLGEAGLCTPAARDGALAWPGQDGLWTAGGRWPAASRNPASRCVRCLSHVKLVCDGSRPTAAKVYLLYAVR